MSYHRTILLLLASALPGAADPFADKATPLLSKYCYDCHGEKKQKGGIEVHQLTSSEQALRHHRFLENIAKQVEDGDMPPDDEDVLPSDEERAALVDEIRSVVSRKQITCATALTQDQVRTWPNVVGVRGESGRLAITVIDGEDVLRRLLASDRSIRDLEVRRAGLAEAFVEITREAA